MSRLTDAQRRAWIAERPKTSALWAIVHLLGSLRIAMVLLITIALACAIATFAESSFNTKVAQYYIYKAPWFMAWLIILCLNLLCAAFTRWPWQRQHAGFVVTHAGIITLLAGAMIGSLGGYEASVTLNKKQPPTNRLVINQSMLQIESPRDGATYLLPFPVEVRRPSDRKPRIESLPDTSLKLVVDRYAENLETVTNLIPGAPGAPAGVLLKLSSQTLGRTEMIPLLLGSADTSHRDFFGLALIELLPQLPARPPPAPVSGTFAETQVLLAAQPSQPIIENPLNRPSGYQFVLAGDPTRGTLELAGRAPSGKQARWPLAELKKQFVSIPGDPAKIQLGQYWPDFAMVDGQPVSRSDNPVNPAVLIRLSGPLSAMTAPAPAQPHFILSLQTNGSVGYQLRRGDTADASGVLSPGTPIALGWNDWQAELQAAYPNAAEKMVVQEMATTAAATEGTPGIHAMLQSPDGTRSEPRWILSGTLEFLRFGGETIPIAFGLKTQQIPFQVGLQKFEVPRDEGTDTPSNFISTLRFEDPRSGATRIDIARMNNPATFPGGLWRSVLGLNYKFSQASWNPNDLNETTLQILYDPGWPLKWLGSLAICSGIFIMFYFKNTSASRHHAPPPSSHELTPAS